jgi:hypothetical protein
MIQYELFFHTKLNVIVVDPVFSRFADAKCPSWREDGKCSPALPKVLRSPWCSSMSCHEVTDEVEDPAQRGNLVLPSKDSFGPPKN